jgi:hypothetical protein
MALFGHGVLPDPSPLSASKAVIRGADAAGQSEGSGKGRHGPIWKKSLRVRRGHPEGSSRSAARFQFSVDPRGSDPIGRARAPLLATRILVIRQATSKQSRNVPPKNFQKTPAGEMRGTGHSIICLT